MLAVVFDDDNYDADYRGAVVLDNYDGGYQEGAVDNVAENLTWLGWLLNQLAVAAENIIRTINDDHNLLR